MNELDAGRALDALVAERVMGLRVVATDWLCGYMPDGCGLEASSTLAGDGFCNEPHPVYAREGGTWPPAKRDYAPWTHELFRDQLYADVIPVPFYSTDIAAAWAVVERVTSWGLYFKGTYEMVANETFAAAYLDYQGAINDGYAPTLAAAICLTALNAVRHGWPTP